MRLLKVAIPIAALVLLSGCTEPVHNQVSPDDFVNHPDKLAGQYVQTETLIDHEDHREWVQVIIVCTSTGKSTSCHPVIIPHHDDTYGIHSSKDPNSNEIHWVSHDDATYDGSFTGVAKAHIYIEKDHYFLWWKIKKGGSLIRDVESVHANCVGDGGRPGDICARKPAPGFELAALVGVLAVAAFMVRRRRR